MRNVRVFDGETLIEGATMTFDETGIVSAGIADPAPETSAGEAAAMVDGNGGTLLPGLIDAHTHLLPGSLQQSIGFG